MPRFNDIQSIFSPDKIMSKDEILRAIKFGLSSEFESTQVYQQIMESTNNEQVKIVLTDIIRDEMHHAGALLQLLTLLSPADAAEYGTGARKALQELGYAGNENLLAW